MLIVLSCPARNSSSSEDPMHRIHCSVQNYAWGKPAQDSLVASLKRKVDPESINESMPYAELWMGTHPSGPSKLDDGSLLSDLLVDNPALIGQTPADCSTNDLPFLFKILSISTALSIQAHPCKALARELHQRFPEFYKDSNHKPEMVIALSSFECLCSFRMVDEIRSNLHSFPEFEELLKSQNFDPHDDSMTDLKHLQELFSAYIECPDEVSQHFQRSLSARLASNLRLSELEQLILKLMSQYPGDNGVFAPIFLNYIKLEKGQSFYIGANEPHAYLSGDCLECMALSDNVVRAGLTPKHKDIPILCDMLTYRTGLPDFIKPRPCGENVSLYQPLYSQCPEFAVEAIVFSPGKTSLNISASGSILLLVEGPNVLLMDNTATLHATIGSAIFIAAGTEVSVVNSETTNCFAYRAIVNKNN